ncbi:conserved hypothetical protein [Frankia canadensis]|uniref:Uncharacterized protein n=1 Tax=Frankia canadensis TaxID=1836972 RepID=A0A2I2KN34_9ACTN|nr:hypothetical protein [Frankia canadensis]SNQ47081.1 conserved hypothetical protein [Frankia canadensis]SOU54371.1 conserved hypothetical protein [Frankia canadensis]
MSAVAVPAVAILLADLAPDSPGQAHATRMLSRVATVDEWPRRMATVTLPYAEVLVDALDAYDPALAAAAIRSIVAHVRAGRARWHELDPATGTLPLTGQPT